MRYLALLFGLILAQSGLSRIAGVESGFSRIQSTTSSGVYTAAQAAAGEQIYFARCSMCHGDELEGRERAPALAGPQFLDAWNGKDLRKLLDSILTMPPGDKPVTSAEALEVLTFLLQSSEMPSGPTALPADRAKLAEITFERQKP